MNNKEILKLLILEALQSELNRNDDEEIRDYRLEPLYIANKDKYLLFDEDQPENEEGNLELGAVLEDGTPVCEGCLVAYMNENYKMLTEAEYRGRKVSLGKPMPNDPGGKKKSKVYVRDPKTGNVKKITFGDRTMRIKKSNPKRRKSFRARHNCSNPGPRTKAKFWSCRAWE